MQFTDRYASPPAQACSPCPSPGKDTLCATNLSARVTSPRRRKGPTPAPDIIHLYNICITRWRGGGVGVWKKFPMFVTLKNKA
jgi:hypothetical protein